VFSSQAEWERAFPDAAVSLEAMYAGATSQDELGRAFAEWRAIYSEAAEAWGAMQVEHLRRSGYEV